MTKATIVQHNGYPAIEIGGTVYPPMTATITSTRRVNGKWKREVDEAYYKALGDSGIKIYYVMCNNLDLENCAVSDFAAEAEKILSAVPDAYIIVRIVLNPRAEWIANNPDHVVTYSDGRKIKTTLPTESFHVTADGMFSLCSEKWREDMGKTLLKTMDEIDALPFRDRIVGFFLGAGGTSEWYYYNPIEDFQTGAYADLSKSFAVEFQKYLDEKYGAGKVTARIPDANARFFAEELDRKIASPKNAGPSDGAPEPPQTGTHHGSFLDIDRCGNTFDFYRAWTEGTANSVVHFAKLIKEHRPHTLVGAFYGSMGNSEIIWASNSSAVRKILDSGYVDFLANPGVYENRQPGGFAGQRQCPDSFRLRNTMYIVEDDTRTHAENRLYAELFGMYTMEDTLQVLKRDFGRNVCEDLQSWWFDQHIGGGRYKYPEVYDLFAEQQKIAQLAYRLDRRKENEIAFIYDEESVHVASKQSTDECVQVIRNYEIANIGAGVDSYFHNDMSNPDMPDYKLYVFCNCFYLSDREREDIKTKLKKNHATALFLYGNGLINPDREKMLDVAHMSELTGIRCVEHMQQISPVFKVNPQAHPLTDRLDTTKYFGSFLRQREGNLLSNYLRMPRSYLFPILCAEDTEAVSLGTYMQANLTAAAVKEADGYTSIYCGAKYISADFVREAARFAGCHIYEEDGHVLYASKNFITVHAAKNGEIKIHLKEACTPFELYEKKNYGENVAAFTFAAQKGDTKMFYLKQND